MCDKVCMHRIFSYGKKVDSTNLSAFVYEILAVKLWTSFSYFLLYFFPCWFCVTIYGNAKVFKRDGHYLLSFTLNHFKSSDITCAWRLAVSALTLLVGQQYEDPACKKLSDEVLVWLSVPKPHHLLPHINPDWFQLSGTGLPRLSWKRGR